MIKSFPMTNIGKKRKLNQDYVFTSETPVGTMPNLFLVADGMGGHNAGDYASKYAVETVVASVEAAESDIPEIVLKEAIEKANTAVYEKSKEDTTLEGMGTTMVAAVCKDDMLYVANVGDSRLYVINKYKIAQITKDHSWVEEMVRRGGLGREEARNHPDKNIITRAVGVEPSVRADVFCVPLQEEDTILICTDGLTNMLEDEAIRSIVVGETDIVSKAEELIDKANEKGGNDNISVVLIQP